MTTLQNWLLKACDALGLRADLAYVATLSDGQEVQTVARIRNLGAEHGMLVVRSYEDVRPFADCLARAGFGYSVLDEPGVDEVFDLDSFKEMFLDWGWSGTEKSLPASLR